MTNALWRLLWWGSPSLARPIVVDACLGWSPSETPALSWSLPAPSAFGWVAAETTTFSYRPLAGCND